MTDLILQPLAAVEIPAGVGQIGLRMPRGIHHSVVLVRNLDTSLRFYRDGLGLDVLLDREVEGGWPQLFDGPSRKLRAVFLDDASVPDVTAGVLELNAFVGGEVPPGTSPSHSTTGLFMLSYFVDVDATLKWLADLDLGGPPRRITQATPNGDITIALVRDPDDVRVLLVPGSIAQRH
jgi:catechol 2,3-dioxygenase-like lactoylglutathione lyase family enzyme